MANSTRQLTRKVLLLRLIVLGFLSLIVTQTTSGQYRFDSWTTDNGLPQVSVNSILQTRDGFLWFTTFAGVVRYDGLRFQVFNTGNTQGLRTSRFGKLIEDQDGSLWISTEGQGVTRYQDGSFVTYTKENGLPDNWVQDLLKDAEGNALVKSGDRLFQLKNDAFLPYSPINGEPVTNVIYRTTSGGSWYLDGARLRKFENGRVTVDFTCDFSVRRVIEDSQGRLWIGGNGNLLSMLKDGKLTTYGERDGFPPSRLNTVFEDRSGRLWVGTRTGGLLLFKDNRFSAYTTAAGLLGNDVSSLFQDREGTMWVGTTAGLSRMSERVVTTYDAHDGIAANNVYPIFEDRQGQIWIGSWNGLTRYSGGVFTNVGKQYDVADAQITSLFEDRDGGFWIGTWSHGVKHIKDGVVTAFAPQQPPGTHVRAIIQDRLGAIWFGTAVGLVKYQKGVFTTYTAKDGFIGGEIFVIHEDRAGQLWLGTDVGLIKLVDGVFTSFTEKDGIAANIVRTVTEDNGGALWIGMYDSGLYRFKQGRFTHFTTNEGLFDNGAFRIIEDSKANFWISCNLGIYRVRKADLNDLAEGRIRKVNSIPYNKRDGMLNSECNGAGQPAGIKASDGRIWFPTQQGVVVINPDAVPINSQPPPVIIESFLIDTQEAALHSPITIQPGQIYFEVHYSGLSFINPELVKFKYKLVGLDKDWIDASTRRVAYYSHLPAGTYRFVVQAANRDGVWNEQGATIQIIVLPPFWRTWWFITIAAVTLALAIYLLFRQRIAKLKRENKAQEHFSRQLIESQENERKRIAAELHDSVGQSLLIIKNRAAMGRRFLDNRAMALEQIDQVEEVAAQSIKELRQIAYDLRPYQIDNVGLTDALKELIRRINEAGPVKINSSVAFVDDLSEEKAINLFRIMQEALNNIVKHSGASEATAIVKRDDREMLMTIEDNGCGFKPDQIEMNGTRGLGLSGLHERARMMDATLTVHSTIGQGTSVRLKMDLEGSDDEE